VFGPGQCIPRPRKPASSFRYFNIVEWFHTLYAAQKLVKKFCNDERSTWKLCIRSFIRNSDPLLPLPSPPVDLTPVSYPDDGYQHDIIVNICDNTPVSNTIFPEIAKLFAAKCLAYAAGVVGCAYAVTKERQYTLGNLGVEFPELFRGAVRKFNAPSHIRPAIHPKGRAPQCLHVGEPEFPPTNAHPPNHRYARQSLRSRKMSLIVL
jgi:hypothetical protein